MTMKKILYSLFLFCGLTLFVSCEGITSEDPSKVTQFADLELEGEALITWPLNTTFVDPGYSAFEGDIDLKDKVVVNGSVNSAKGGKYTLFYSVKNSDGYSASVSRTVYVYDPSSPIVSGTYSSTISMNNTNSGATTVRGPFSITLFPIGDGKCWIEDLLGGWYYIGSGYGAAYAGFGEIKIADDNTLSIIKTVNLPWGAPCIFFDESTYDPDTQTFLLKSRMADVSYMLFTVTLSNPVPFN